jgi:hypothetical protein
MIRRVGCVVLVLLSLAFFAGLLLTAQTVGVEAWHDSALPQSAFVAIRSAGTEWPSGHALLALPQPRKEVRSVRLPVGSVSAAPSAHFDSSMLTGLASWWDIGSGLYAALPGYVAGTHVTVIVCAGSRCLTLPVVTSCQCLVGTASARIIDLSRDAFARLAPLSQGLVEVTIP